MDKSKNLQLWLPEDSDPLEVSKLSENFEALDQKIAEMEGSGGDIPSSVRDMAVGDITYSARNLEALSGGTLIACDQRTIDTGAYPDIPEHVLYWPYPAAVGEKASNPPSTGGGEFCFGVPSLSTDGVKYIPTSSAYIAIYDEESGALKWISKVTSTNIASNAWFCRISNDLVYYSGVTGSGPTVYLYSNDLTTREDIASVANAANYIARSSAVGAGVYRLANGRLLILSYVNSSNNLNGVRYTDDIFKTILSSSAPTEMETNINRAVTMTGGDGTSAYRDAANHFHPVVIDGEKICVICYPKNVNKGTYTTNPITDAEIEAVYPTIYYSDNNGISFQKRPLPDGLMETLRAFFNMDVGKPSVGYYYTFFWLGGLCFRLGDHIYIRYTNGYVYYNSSSGTQTDYPKYIMYIAVNLKTNQIDYVSDAIDADGNVNGPAAHRIFSNSNMRNFVYVKKDHALYYYTGSDIHRLDLQTFEVETLTGMLYPGSLSGSVLQIGPTHYAMYLGSGMDVRLNQKGVGIPARYGCRIIDTENFIPGKSEIEASTAFPVGNITSFFSGTAVMGNVQDTANTPMTEYNGDIYVAYGDTMYKIPKNKKQMPYIKNGYMKVLGEEVSE